MHTIRYVPYAHDVAVLIWGLSVLMAFALFMAAYYGGLLAGRRTGDDRLHRKWAWASAVTTFMAVSVIEPAFRLFHLPYTRFFFFPHLPLLLFYGALLVLALVFNGGKQRKKPDPRFPRRHNLLGRYAQWSGLLTALTGDWLVFVLLWRPFPGR